MVIESCRYSTDKSTDISANSAYQGVQKLLKIKKKEGKYALIFYQFLSTNSSKKCMEISKLKICKWIVGLEGLS